MADKKEHRLAGLAADAAALVEQQGRFFWIPELSFTSLERRAFAVPQDHAGDQVIELVAYATWIRREAGDAALPLLAQLFALISAVTSGQPVPGVSLAAIQRQLGLSHSSQPVARSSFTEGQSVLAVCVATRSKSKEISR